MSDLFRREAVEHHEKGDHEGSLLRLAPRWVRWAYPTVLITAAAAIAFLSVARIAEWAGGPAVIRAEGRVEVTAPAEGLVESIEVSPGQHVVAGQVLARLRAVSEGDELRRLDDEYERQLVKLLESPEDRVAREALTGLRAQRDLARARVEARVLRAPRAGLASDVRLRLGQRLAPGDVVIAITPEDARFVVVTALPGAYRPRLRAGLPLRVQLDGLRADVGTLVIEHVGEIVGPGEVARALGQELEGTMDVTGPLVLVRARLAETTFRSSGQALRFVDGMPGRAEARVGVRRAVSALLPDLN